MSTRLAPLTLTAALAALGPACAPDNTASVQPYAICAMPDDCTFKGECDGQYIGTPTLDISYGQEMWLAVEMHNQLSNNAVEGVRVNTHDAHFESYSLEYDGIRAAIDPALVTDIAASGGRAQQVIPADGTSVIGFEPIPIGVVEALAATVPDYPDYDEVQVTATLKGRYDDGSKWEAPFKFPVRLCLNCIGAFCDDPTQHAVAACPSLAQAPAGAPTCQ